VKNGETILLGGLLQREEMKTVNKVPGLGDLPLLGNLFRTTNTERLETELVIMITPKMIASADSK
jgi:type II secretory pathway component GspD/PulD (secretin)